MLSRDIDKPSLLSDAGEKVHCEEPREVSKSVNSLATVDVMDIEAGPANIKLMFHNQQHDAASMDINMHKEWSIGAEL